MMNKLERFDFESANEQEADGYKITDLGSATWAMRKLRALDKADAENETAARAQKNDIDAWLAKETEGNENSRDFFKNKLADYLDELRKDDPKAKISTPYGTVSSRKTPASVQWNDDLVIESLKKQKLTDLIRIKEEVDKKAVKKSFKFVNGKYVNDDGQVLQGASEKPATTTTTFKIND